MYVSLGLVYCAQVINHLSCAEHPGESPECSNQQLARPRTAQLADSDNILKQWVKHQTINCDWLVKVWHYFVHVCLHGVTYVWLVYLCELNTQLCGVHTENIMGNIIICSKDILQKFEHFTSRCCVYHKICSGILVQQILRLIINDP